MRFFAMAVLVCAFAIPTFAQAVPIPEQHVRRPEGVVRDVTGAPVAGAEVAISKWPGSEKALRSTVTKIDGHFIVWRLAPGEYAMNIQKNGFETARYHLTVDKNGSTELLIVQLKVNH